MHDDAKHVSPQPNSHPRDQHGIIFSRRGWITKRYYSYA